MYNETEKTAVLPEFYDKWTLNGAVKMLPLLMGKNSEVMMTSEKKERKETQLDEIQRKFTLQMSELKKEVDEE